MLASLERLTLACLAKSPADRPANAETLSQLLADCADGGSWKQEEAERWWRMNLPTNMFAQTPKSARAITGPTSAQPTL